MSLRSVCPNHVIISIMHGLRGSPKHAVVQPVDIYGDDLYGDAPEAFGDVPSPKRPDEAAAPQVCGGTPCSLQVFAWGDAGTTATDDMLTLDVQAAAEGSAAAAAASAPESPSAREAELQVCAVAHAVHLCNLCKQL